MIYKERELIELHSILLNYITPPVNEVPLTLKGDIDLNAVNAIAVIHAQNRALGAMLDELLAILKPKPAAKVKTASKAPTKTTTKRR